MGVEVEGAEGVQEGSHQVKYKPLYLTWQGRMMCEICGVEEKDHA
jgi:hypothetical protein